ncbi:unnamed protein product [Taenia asiatica]|uniref:Flagellar motor switch protein FliM n=1 Tax=Taenia asiatica TaxID=60517 RepID=A0A0R3W4Z1_TAEAS|nr:unnamed protein product [Taenia asiatica]
MTDGQAIIANDFRYSMIIQFVVPTLQEMDVDGMQLQQDGARETIQLLYEPFPGRAISRDDDQNRPP